MEHLSPLLLRRLTEKRYHDDMACAEYEALKQPFFAALIAEDKVHFDQRHVPNRERLERIDRTRAAVEILATKSRWHVQQCEQCKVEGNQPLFRPPL